MTGALRLAVALICGLLFGCGLALSGMLDPARVRGFLDVTGPWDPSLAFVLGGAVSVSSLGYALARRMSGPALARDFEAPSKTRIDASLILGAVLFGIGWGLSGFCPGPAIAALSIGTLPVFVFVCAMLVGMTGHRLMRLGQTRRLDQRAGRP